MSTLVVSEVFGPTFQGEGPSAGRRASFIRLGGCNLACSWCDTPYSWDASRFDLRAELGRRTIAEILDEVRGHDTGLVVITGGEPLLQQDSPGWDQLVRRLIDWADVEVETNGTVVPIERAWLRFTVSPKLPSAGTGSADPAAIREHVELESTFKFVAVSLADLADIEVFVALHRIERNHVWVMPEGTDGRHVELARELADGILAAGWNLTLRQHVLLWGAARGR